MHEKNSKYFAIFQWKMKNKLDSDNSRDHIIFNVLSYALILYHKSSMVAKNSDNVMRNWTNVY